MMGLLWLFFQINYRKGKWICACHLFCKGKTGKQLPGRIRIFRQKIPDRNVVWAQRLQRTTYLLYFYIAFPPRSAEHYAHSSFPTFVHTTTLWGKWGWQTVTQGYSESYMAKWELNLGLLGLTWVPGPSMEPLHQVAFHWLDARWYLDRWIHTSQGRREGGWRGSRGAPGLLLQ